MAQPDQRTQGQTSHTEPYVTYVALFYQIYDSTKSVLRASSLQVLVSSRYTPRCSKTKTLQNHALDLPTPEYHSDTLMVLAESDQIPTIIQIPRQIPRSQLFAQGLIEPTTSQWACQAFYVLPNLRQHKVCP